MERETVLTSCQMEICLKLLSTSIRMLFFLAILDMQSILSDYTGTTGR
ncbi:Bgt-20527 [Blumeria graminis f. sp. tritici]|uniref:Bgt-20527 n=1 Tax=Blumeria graminis f. sp. tritici TaxID=62690 RepID=A0A9X9QE18_BLUGR|nr:Bgt-20527 [Blumeria graminis f. sp. tritici]